jgi:hypothetical protein
VQINFSFDSSVNNAPAGFKTAAAYVATVFDNLFTNNIKVTINLGWGEVGGQALSAGALGNSLVNYYSNGYTYAQVKAGLTAVGTGANQVSEFAALPTLDPTGGASFTVGTTEGYILGILTAADVGVDATTGFFTGGSIGFGSDQQYDFTPNQVPAAGVFSFVGTLEHEVSEVLGRVSFAGGGAGSATNTDAPMDLFRYSAPGVRDLTSIPPTGYSVAYLSLDGGTTNLDNYNTVAAKGDLGDYADSAVNDSFDYEDSGGDVGYLTTTDIQLMNAIGINTAANPTNTVAYGVTLLNQTVGSGVSWTILPGGQVIGGSITSGGVETVQGIAVVNGLSVGNGGKLVLQLVNGAPAVANLTLAVGAVIDITNNGFAGVTAVVSGGALVVSNGATTLETIGLAGGGAGLAFTVSDDGSGGANITVVSPGATSNTGANISTQFDALNANNAVTSIVITDGNPVTITQTQFNADTRALGLIAGAHTVVETNIAGQTYTSRTLTYDAQDRITASVLHDNANNVMGSSTLTYGTGSAYTVTINVTGTDYSKQIVSYDTAGHLASSEYDGYTDKTYTSYKTTYTGGVLHDTMLSGFTTGAYAIDIAYDSSGRNSVVTSYNNASTVLTTANYSYGAAGAYTVTTTFSSGPYTSQVVSYTGSGQITSNDLIGYTGQAYTRIHFDYSVGAMTVETFFNNDNSHTVQALTTGVALTDTSLNEAFYLTTGDTLTLSSTSFGQDTIRHYTPGSDTFDISTGVFASSATFLAAAHDDVHGNAVVTFDANDTLTFIGVNTAQLTAHQSDFHFI